MAATALPPIVVCLRRCLRRALMSSVALVCSTVCCTMITDSFRAVKGVRAPSVKSLRSWTQDQDEKLIAAVKSHGAQKWSVLCSEVDGRTGKQCRERWHNHLNPDINSDPWTESEDDMIMYMYKRIGSKWSTIAKKMNGRTDNAIKNRFNTINRSSRYANDMTECNMFEASAIGFEDEVSQLCHDGEEIIDVIADNAFLESIGSMQFAGSLQEMAVTTDTSDGGDLVLDLNALLGDVPLEMGSTPPTPRTPVTDNDNDSIGNMNITDMRKPGIYFVTKTPTVPLTIRKELRVCMRSSISERPLKIGKLF